MCSGKKTQRAEFAQCPERADAQSEEGLFMIQPVRDF